LIGATAAGGAGYYYLLEEYQTASNLLLSSVEDLQASTNKVMFYPFFVIRPGRDVLTASLLINANCGHVII